MLDNVPVFWQTASSVQQVLMILHISLRLWLQEKKRLYFQLPEPSGTHCKIFVSKNMLPTQFIVIKHHNYEVDPRDSVLQAPEP